VTAIGECHREADGQCSAVQPPGAGAPSALPGSDATVRTPGRNAHCLTKTVGSNKARSLGEVSQSAACVAEQAWKEQGRTHPMVRPSFPRFPPGIFLRGLSDLLSSEWLPGSFQQQPGRLQQQAFLSLLKRWMEGQTPGHGRSAARAFSSTSLRMAAYPGSTFSTTSATPMASTNLHGRGMQGRCRRSGRQRVRGRGKGPARAPAASALPLVPVLRTRLSTTKP
jgi:hypothetical protein